MASCRAPTFLELLVDAKTKALAKWPRENVMKTETRVEEFLKTFPSVEKLGEFWEDVRHLSWPETFGSPPWEFASSVAFQVFSSDHRQDPIQWLENQAQRYLGDPMLSAYHRDTLRALRSLEHNLILEGDQRQQIARDSMLRALSRGLKTGESPIRLPNGDSAAAVQYTDITFTGFGMREKSYFCVVTSADPLAGDLVLYSGSYPADAGGDAVKSYPMRQILRGVNAEPDLRELARIFRHSSHDRDGYQWGDTRGNDGDFGAEKLTHLVLLGYARRTGRDVPNQLGGVWPEVKVTPAGARAIIESGILLQMQQEQPRPTAKAAGSSGEFAFDAKTGAVLGPLYGDDPELAPVRIDVAELQDAYPDEEIAGREYDVLDLGYTTVNGIHEEPDEDWRAEFRDGRIGLRL